MTRPAAAVTIGRLERPVTPEDRSRVLALEAGSFAHPWTAETFDRMLESPVTAVYVARAADGTIAGFCACWVIDDELHINTVAVDAAVRRQGIGRRLLEETLRQTGARRATLEVRRSNIAALALYRSLGFDTRAVRRDYYQNPPEDGLILWWDP